MLELNDVRVSDAPVNFDFTHQLLLRSASSYARFLDNFCRLDILGLRIGELVALRKATFTEELPLDISTDGYLSTWLLESLFDNYVLLLDGSHTAHLLICL